jgi:hypothetical protein
MASLVLSGDTSGSITVSAPAVAGSTTQTLVNVTGTLAPIVSGTAVASTSGTSIDFTGIPSWVKRITVMFTGISVSGTSLIQTQLGTSGGVQTSGYSGMYIGGAQSGAQQAVSVTTGIPTGMYQTAAGLHYGQIIICLLESATGTWAYSGMSTSPAAPAVAYSLGGAKTLSGTLTQVRITTVNGTDTFDAGTINIIYE